MLLDSSEGPVPRSLNVSITPTVTPASLPLDGVTSTWVITCIAFPSSQVSATCTSYPGHVPSNGVRESVILLNTSMPLPSLDPPRVGGGSLSRETEHAGGPAGALHIGVVDAISAG